MSKTKPGDADSGRPLPHRNALLVCEKVTESQITGKITLHNLIEKFELRAYPGRSTRFSIFLPRPGRYELVVFLDGRQLASQHFEAEIANGSER
jgi:hypothetical protein